MLHWRVLLGIYLRVQGRPAARQQVSTCSQASAAGNQRASSSAYGPTNETL